MHFLWMSHEWHCSCLRSGNCQKYEVQCVSETKMKTALLQLKHLVSGEHFDVLESIILEHGLDFIISHEFLDFCRRKKEARIVIFVTTLAIHNATQKARPQLLEQCYSSILHKEIRLTKDRNTRTNILKNTLQCIIENADISAETKRFQQLTGSDNDWHLSFELFLDHGQEYNAYKILNKKLEKGKGIDFALLCGRSLFERSINVKGSENIDWDHCIQSQKIIYQALKRNNIAKVPSNMAKLIAQYYSFVNKHDETIEWCSKATDDQVLVKYIAAEAYVKKGDVQKALALLDSFLDLLSVQTHEWIDANFNNADTTGEKHEASDFNSQSATQALTDLQTTLDKVKTKAFLVSGTLLGYAREKAFMAHDKDIDVGIFEADNIFEVINTLMASGKFSVMKGYFKIDRIFQMPVVHFNTGMAIDIFIYHPDGENLITGVQGSFGYTQNFRFSKFDLKEIDFIGARFYAPSDIDKNLTENFGDWRTPDPHYISHLQCPTTVNVGGEVYMLVCRLEMIQAVIKGKKIKLDRIVNIMREHAGVELSMNVDLIQKLSNRFGSRSEMTDGARDAKSTHENY